MSELPDDRTEPPLAGTERETLLGFLDLEVPQIGQMPAGCRRSTHLSTFSSVAVAPPRLPRRRHSSTHHDDTPLDSPYLRNPLLRDSLRLKTSGLDAEELGRTAIGTLTLGGLLKHLAFVEDHWFSSVWAQRPPPEPWLSADWAADNDWDLTSASHDSPAALLSLWESAVTRSRAVVSGTEDLGTTVPPPDASSDPRAHFSRRWILTHMVEEYARHLGHADLIRESVDGAVGE